MAQYRVRFSKPGGLEPAALRALSSTIQVPTGAYFERQEPAARGVAPGWIPFPG